MIKLGLYKHYKGNLYSVISAARHSETCEEMVVYQALYGDYRFWVRPKDMFLEKITFNNNLVQRFEYIGPIFEEFPSIR